MATYVADLRNWMSGILHWHREVDRYKAEWLSRRAHGFLPDRPSAVPVPALH
jgi:germacradienol/geosmin synthase